MEDIEKLFDYIALKLPQIDASRIAVGGGSAGGYVARLAALYARPRPKALYSLYGSKFYALLLGAESLFSKLIWQSEATFSHNCT